MNGHRTHRTCYYEQDIIRCPLCFNKEMKFCKNKNMYSYAKRKGGKKRISSKYRTKNKSKRKTYKKKRFKKKIIK